jgi:hypothetical protein
LSKFKILWSLFENLVNLQEKRVGGKKHRTALKKAWVVQNAARFYRQGIEILHESQNNQTLPEFVRIFCITKKPT